MSIKKKILQMGIESQKLQFSFKNNTFKQSLYQCNKHNNAGDNL